MAPAHVLPLSAVREAAAADVVVVGSGAGGAAAALAARWAGAGDVVVLERDPEVFGGTTAKSGGTFWIPDNPLMREAGIRDEKTATLRFMAKRSYPESYDAAAPRLGLTELEHGWLSQYYDVGAEMAAELRRRGALPLSSVRFHGGALTYDYVHDAENPARQGRMLGAGMDEAPAAALRAAARAVAPLALLRTARPAVKELMFLNELPMDLTFGVGYVLCERLRGALEAAGVAVRMGAAVDAVVVDGGGDVVGVRAGGAVTLARRGVVFASGGFSHSAELRRRYLPRRPVDGTGACAGNDGILVRVAEELGLDLAHMDRIWGAQCFAEQALRTFETPSCVFQLRGDSVLVVDRTGRRVMNEKAPYDTRVRRHWEEGGRFLFLVADRRAVDLFGMDGAPTLPADPASELYVTGSSVGGFAAALRRRVAAVAAAAGAGGFGLSAGFAGALSETLRRFNAHARAGADPDFGRGATESEQQWQYRQSAAAANATMHPIDASSLYGVILAAQAIDTKGGPRVDLRARCMRGGAPVGGLYACGNAAASISGDAYWSGGATIGIAMVGGWVAGRDAAARPRRAAAPRL